MAFLEDQTDHNSRDVLPFPPTWSQLTSVPEDEKDDAWEAAKGSSRPGAHGVPRVLTLSLDFMKSTSFYKFCDTLSTQALLTLTPLGGGGAKPPPLCFASSS